jgi:hypothetical protein
MNSKGNTGVWSCGNVWMEDVYFGQYLRWFCYEVNESGIISALGGTEDVQWLCWF